MFARRFRGNLSRATTRSDDSLMWRCHGAKCSCTSPTAERAGRYLMVNLVAPNHNSPHAICADCRWTWSLA